jgi:lysophospholipase L1-like esterase
MSNQNASVVTFTIVTTLFLLASSLFATFTHSDLLSLTNISIVSAVVYDKAATLDTMAVADTVAEVARAKEPSLPDSARSMDYYETPNRLISFYGDTAVIALPKVMNKLQQLMREKRGKVRIAWLGDSMIEGDLLTQTVRKKLQSFFGGFGVGFLSATSVTAGFRSTARHQWHGVWREENFKTKSLTAPLFLSGHLFYPEHGSITVTDNTVKGSGQLLVKSIICGQQPQGVDVMVNNRPLHLSTPNLLNRVVVDSSTSTDLAITFSTDNAPVYGVSFEPASGVVVDNFSFRGITGLELSKLDTNFLKELQQVNHYDLVVIEYGANLMFRPDDVDYSWYQSHVIPVIRKLKMGMGDAELLIISTSDRAFKYGDVYRSATGVKALVKSQATVAFQNKTAFFNMFSSMGGTGTIVKWADSSTSLANKDYVHPNHKGAEVLGKIFFDAFMNDYYKAGVIKPLMSDTAQVSPSPNFRPVSATNIKPTIVN